MKESAQKTKATTQKFTEILDIVDSTVLLSSNNACTIIEVQATNFALLSQEEQNARVLSYSALLNSLSFPIQVFIRSKKIDISSYLKLLELEIEKSQNQLLKSQIMLYKDFVQELVKTNAVLDKKFYIAIPYNGLESSISMSSENFILSAKANLTTKSESLHAMLRRMNLSAKTLNKEELVKLFHEIYNGDFERINEIVKEAGRPLVRANPLGAGGKEI
jgi:type IV secretory pathway VirB4 component